MIDAYNLFLSFQFVVFISKQGDVNQALKIVNERFARIAALREKNEEVLSAVLDALLSLLCLKTGSEMEAPTANLATLFVRGRCVIPLSLVREINVGIFSFLFSALVAPRFTYA